MWLDLQLRDVSKHVRSRGNLRTKRIECARGRLTRAEVGAARSVRLHRANQCARLHLDIAPGSGDNGRRAHIRDRASLGDCTSPRGIRAYPRRRKERPLRQHFGDSKR